MQGVSETRRNDADDFRKYLIISRTVPGSSGTQYLRYAYYVTVPSFHKSLRQLTSSALLVRNSARTFQNAHIGVSTVNILGVRGSSEFRLTMSALFRLGREHFTRFRGS